MKRLALFFRLQTPRLIALIFVLALYGFARLPSLSESDRADLASHFKFDRLQLLQQDMLPGKVVRDVHPDLQRIRGWISTVGASVAMADFDGDGLVNEICQVEPKKNRVLVAAIPGTPVAY